MILEEVHFRKEDEEEFLIYATAISAVAYFFFFCSMLICVTVLLLNMKQIGEAIKWDELAMRLFRQEKRTLLLIIILFDFGIALNLTVNLLG